MDKFDKASDCSCDIAVSESYRLVWQNVMFESVIMALKMYTAVFWVLTLCLHTTCSSKILVTIYRQHGVITQKTMVHMLVMLYSVRDFASPLNLHQVKKGVKVTALLVEWGLVREKVRRMSQSR
jgi:hypothetical protein